MELCDRKDYMGLKGRKLKLHLYLGYPLSLPTTSFQQRTCWHVWNMDVKSRTRLSLPPRWNKLTEKVTKFTPWRSFNYTGRFPAQFDQTPRKENNTGKVVWPPLFLISSSHDITDVIINSKQHYFKNIVAGDDGYILECNSNPRKGTFSSGELIIGNAPGIRCV